MYVNGCRVANSKLEVKKSRNSAEAEAEVEETILLEAVADVEVMNMLLFGVETEVKTEICFLLPSKLK